MTVERREGKEMFLGDIKMFSVLLINYIAMQLSCFTVNISAGGGSICICIVVTFVYCHRNTQHTYHVSDVFNTEKNKNIN